MWKYCLTFFLVLNLVNSQGLRRSKRAFLVWPEGFSRVTFLCGFGIPVDLEDETVLVSSVAKANYRVPTNSSVYTSPNVVYSKRKKRSISRWDIYGLIAELAQNYGFGGRGCILRAICEIAATKLDRKGGLMNEIVHALFTPTTTFEELNHHTDNEYYAAQNIGETDRYCTRFSSDCPISFMEMFSRIL